MSYETLLQSQIKELEEKIAREQGDVKILKDQLDKLKKKKNTTESIPDQSGQQLLKG